MALVLTFLTLDLTSTSRCHLQSLKLLPQLVSRNEFAAGKRVCEFREQLVQDMVLDLQCVQLPFPRLKRGQFLIGQELLLVEIMLPFSFFTSASICISIS